MTKKKTKSITNDWFNLGSPVFSKKALEMAEKLASLTKLTKEEKDLRARASKKGASITRTGWTDPWPTTYTDKNGITKDVTI